MEIVEKSDGTNWMFMNMFTEISLTTGWIRAGV